MSLSSSDREGNCLLTIDEFLFCYKLVEILKSAGFYQLSSGYRTFKFITSLSSSDKEWKLDFSLYMGFGLVILLRWEGALSLLWTMHRAVLVLKVCITSFCVYA